MDDGLISSIYCPRVICVNKTIKIIQNKDIFINVRDINAPGPATYDDANSTAESSQRSMSRLKYQTLRQEKKVSMTTLM